MAIYFLKATKRINGKNGDPSDEFCEKYEYFFWYTNMTHCFISAENEEQARIIAAGKGTNNCWTDAKYTDCTIIEDKYQGFIEGCWGTG